ncbi:MAG: hypothetical protein HY329_26520 [Chloroflexi bacterium]|nr:hypothetical protein [Chloroflexota bacterium]
MCAGEAGAYALLSDSCEAPVTAQRAAALVSGVVVAPWGRCLRPATGDCVSRLARREDETPSRAAV